LRGEKLPARHLPAASPAAASPPCPAVEVVEALATRADDDGVARTDGREAGVARRSGYLVALGDDRHRFAHIGSPPRKIVAHDSSCVRWCGAGGRAGPLEISRTGGEHVKRLRRIALHV